MSDSEHGCGSSATQADAVANRRLHARFSLRNGLCASTLFRDAAQFGVFGSRRETFQRALVAAAKFRPQTRFPGYEILEEVGRGGMGVIYRAREVRGGRVVALKCLLPADATCDALVTRFRREAETTGNLNHPNIIPVYRVGEAADGLPFFSMKFATNGNVQQTHVEYQRDHRKSVRLMHNVALAIQYAHGRGVLHRDLKPTNILLDEHGEPLVADFGLARWLNDETHLTRTFTLFGTPSYIAPEGLSDSANSRNATTSDIYSLGAILFELLTGRPPLIREGRFAIVLNTAEQPSPSLRQLVPNCDRNLEIICRRCLEREPSVRYQSAKHLAEDLKNWLDHRPIKARPLAIATRFLRSIRRNYLLTATLTFSLVSAIAIAGWHTRGQRLQSAVVERALAARSILVLPVLNLDELSSNLTLTESIAASLQATSSRFGGARVTTEPSFTGNLGKLEDVRKTAQLAKARGALMTTEREIRGKRRITFRLLDSATAEPLCPYISEEMNPEDRRPISEEITRTILTALTAKDRFNTAVPNIDPGLHNDVVLRAIAAGRDLFTRYTTSDYDRAIALFQKAILAEPNSSIAHASLALAASARTHYNSDRRFLGLAQAEANQAIRLAPTSPDAHRALAAVYYQKGRFSDALEEQLQTIEIGGLEERAVSFVGLTLDMLGRCDQALAWYRVASKLEGKPGQLDGLIGDCLTKLCDDEAALEAYKRAEELRPDRPEGAIGICHTRLLRGEAEQAREILRAGHWSNVDEVEQMAAQIEFFDRKSDAAAKLYTNLIASDPDGGGTFYGSVTYRSALGRARQVIGDHATAKSLLQESLVQETTAVNREPTNPEAAYRLAAVEASLGLLESACHHLHEAVTLGWVDYRSLALDPRFDPLRGNPEFNSIIKGLSVKVTEMKRKSRNLLAQQHE